MEQAPSELPRDQRVSFWEKIGYGLGDAACNVVFQMAMTFMAYFYTDVFGITAAAMGTMFLVVRVIASAADLLAGIVCDRTETRWGKFRPYLLWLCVPYAVIATLAFTTPSLSEDGKLVYAYVTFSLVLVVYAFVNVPYCALGAVLTGNSADRVSINSYRFFLATAGGTLVVSTTMGLVEYLGGGESTLGFQRTMMLLTSLAVLMFLACFFSTKERVKQISQTEGSLWNDLKCLISNDQWRVVAGMNCVLFIALTLQDGASVYYARWYLGAGPKTMGAFLTTGMISSMLGALLANSIVGKIPKGMAYRLLQWLIVFFSVLLYFVGREHLTLIFVLYAIQQFFTQMASPVLWSMMADTVDYGERITGRRITGLTFSGCLLFLKLGLALGGAILGWSLSYFGYQEQASSQSGEAIAGIVILFTLAPAIGHATLSMLTKLYRLDSMQQTDRVEKRG